MTFIWPALLLALLVIPIGILAYRAQGRRRRSRAGLFGSTTAPAGGGAVRGADGRGRTPGLRQRLPGALVIAGFGILALAMGRPQGVVSVPRFEGTVILAFDVSGSMAATDFEPTRMEAAKAAARQFVARQPDGVVLGVVAFSDGGLSVQAPTDDHDDILAAIGRLAPERGTSLGQGILTALQTIQIAANPPETNYYSARTPPPTPEPTPVPAGVFAPAAIVVLSDGEQNVDPDPIEVAALAAQRGVRIHTIGIGSVEGTTLEVEGFRVHTQLDEQLLQRIAEITAGSYHAARDEAALDEVYGTLDTELVVADESMELTSIALALGTLALVVGGLLSLRWLGRLP
jgi:Ca-activated chloride channel family protein